MSITVRLDPKVKTAIAGIAAGAWTAIEYPDAVYDETAGVLISGAEVAEIGLTAFGSRKKTEQVPGPAGRAAHPGPQCRGSQRRA